MEIQTSRVARAAMLLLVVTTAGFACRKKMDASELPDSAEPAPPLAAQPGCLMLVGRSVGNAALAVELQICPREGGFTGVVQEGSDATGWSRRGFGGVQEADGSITLVEQMLVDQSPTRGWMFCADTRWSLRRMPTGAWAGRATSRECEDDATLELVEQGSAHPAAPVAQPGIPAPAPVPESVSPAQPEPAQ